MVYIYVKTIDFIDAFYQPSFCYLCMTFMHPFLHYTRQDALVPSLFFVYKKDKMRKYELISFVEFSSLKHSLIHFQFLINQAQVKCVKFTSAGILSFR